MKIILVVPPLTLEERYGDLKGVGTLYPPLGLAYIAAIGERCGHEVKVVESEAMGYSYADIERLITEFQPDVLGMQSFCTTIKRNYKVAEIAKKINPKIQILLENVHVTLFPNESIKKDCIDFLIQGEGEIVFENFLKELDGKKNFKNVKGLVWKQNKKIIQNPRQELIKNLDSLPLPSRHLFPMAKYKASANLRGKRTLNIMTSRGCPYRCTYCNSSQTFGKTHRWNSAARVVEEIKQLKEVYGIDCIQFYDETFTLNKKRIFELCDKLIQEKVDIPWSCFTRVNLVNKELLVKMKEAGCYQIFYGVESGVQRLLDLMKKDITLDQIREAFKWTKEAGMETLASLMFAMPTETVQDSEDTIKFALELDPDYAQWQKTTPYPGNELAKTCLENGELLTDDWSKFTSWNEVVYVPHGRTKEEIVKTTKKAFRKFYLRPSYIIRRLNMLRKLPWQNRINLIKTGLKMLR